MLFFCFVDKSIDDKQIWFLFLVFVGVYLPELAMKGESRFLPSLEGTAPYWFFLTQYSLYNINGGWTLA